MLAADPRCGDKYDNGMSEADKKFVDAVMGPDVEPAKPVICLREPGHVGSHICQGRDHVTIWDDEMYYIFVPEDGFAATTQGPGPKWRA